MARLEHRCTNPAVIWDIITDTRIWYRDNGAKKWDWSLPVNFISFKTHVLLEDMFVQMLVIFVHFCIFMSHFLFDLWSPLIINEFDPAGLCPKQDPDIYFKCDLLCVFEMSVTPVSCALFLP